MIWISSSHWIRRIPGLLHVVNSSFCFAFYINSSRKNFRIRLEFLCDICTAKSWCVAFPIKFKSWSAKFYIFHHIGFRINLTHAFEMKLIRTSANCHRDILESTESVNSEKFLFIQQQHRESELSWALNWRKSRKSIFIARPHSIWRSEWEKRW